MRGQRASGVKTHLIRVRASTGREKGFRKHYKVAKQG